MATMTQAQVQTAYSNAAKIIDQVRRFGAVNATNLISLLQTYEGSYGGDFIKPAEIAIQNCRAAIAGIVTPQYIQSVLTPWIQQYMLSVVGLTNLSGTAAMLQQLYVYMAQNKLAVQSRGITYGTPTAITNVFNGTNAGNGQMIRLTRDQWNYPIENIWPDQKLAQCVQDSQTGAKLGQEVFSVNGNVPYVDQIKRSGSGINATFTARNTDDNNPGLFNASFDQFSSATGAASNPNGITNWTSQNGDSSSFYTFDNTNYFRVAPSTTATNSYALNMVASNVISQLISARGTRLNQSTPYMLAVIYNAQVNSATGVLTARMGNVGASVTVDGKTGWQVLTVPGTMGQGAWPKQFGTANGSTTQIAIEYAKTGGSGLLIAEALFLQGQPHDNTWYWMIPAAAATYNPWKFGDQLRWSDQDSVSTACNQNMFWRGFGVYMPSSNGSSITWADA